jgi:hypothetical protein
MPLFRLTPRTDTLWWCVDGKDPWQPHHDRAFGFVVRAADEAEARWLAHEAAGEEKRALEGVQPWLDSGYSTCEVLEGGGAAEVVLVNFQARGAVRGRSEVRTGNREQAATGSGGGVSPRRS